MSKTASQAAREQQPCALCGVRQSSGTGEHVIPRWARRLLFPQASGPFTITVNGEARRRQQVDSIILPCCLRCNQSMAQRFENPAKALTTRVLGDVLPGLTASEVTLVALWLVKTWLLLSHPRTEFKDVPGVTPWTLAPPRVFEWLISGTDPPAGLSLWAHRVDESAPGLSAGPRLRVQLPTVVTDSGAHIRFLATKLRLSTLVVTLAYHPGWPIDLSADDVTPRLLWPSDGGGLAALPLLEGAEVSFVEGPEITFLEGLFGTVTLPPLRPGSDPLSDVGPYTLFGRAPANTD